jgi:hypothetical protein
LGVGLFFLLKDDSSTETVPLIIGQDDRGEEVYG